jgi:hypothetical protein
LLLSQRTDGGAWQEIGSYSSIYHRQILELAVPFKDLQLARGQELRMAILVLEHGLEVARYPHHNPATFLVPGEDFEATLWRV